MKRTIEGKLIELGAIVDHLDENKVYAHFREVINSENNIVSDWQVIIVFENDAYDAYTQNTRAKTIEDIFIKIESIYKPAQETINE